MLGQIALFALISTNVIKCLFTCVNLQVFFNDWMSEWNGFILNFSILKNLRNNNLQKLCLMSSTQGIRLVFCFDKN